MSHELLTECRPQLSKRSSVISHTRVKELLTELRRAKPWAAVRQRWYESLLWRLKHDSQFLRTSTQVAFLLLCIWIGIEFHLFVRWGLSGGNAPYVSRPPGVEGFLPISALISSKYWVDTSIINHIHPSGFFIFIAILVLGLALKKAFCGWLCPIGTISESLWMIGGKIFGRNLQVTKWLDYPLRSLKYLLLFFFMYSVWQMDTKAMQTFIESPYNRVADVKMYLFFADISWFALWSILILIALSIVIKNFWCRYLCPYGALLGGLSILSPLKVTRRKSTCINCELCTTSCPSAINVHRVARVWSDECMACMKCVEACPVKDTLDLRMSNRSLPVPSWVFGALVVGVFIAMTGLAMLTGYWQNSITKEEYGRHFRQISSSAYEHFGAEPKPHDPNK